ncbi:MarR family transcriptional regulator, partial [Streptomyces scopuliridis]|uniref:MarR family transcriptional regulator n=1 Tax=Streptomyces scopuliridis TaxID=452529 RepID=UPI0036B64DE3
MDPQQPDASAAPDDGHELEVLAVLPRLTQLGNVLNRGRLVERAMETAAIHVDRPAMSVLLSLHMADGPLRIGEIAARMQVVGPHVTRQVNELERRGLVVRGPPPGDQRGPRKEGDPDGGAAGGRGMGPQQGMVNQPPPDR